MDHCDCVKALNSTDFQGFILNDPVDIRESECTKSVMHAAKLGAQVVSRKNELAARLPLRRAGFSVRIIPLWFWFLTSIYILLLVTFADGLHFYSGEVAATRIPRELWSHRLRMAKALGLTTVSTYVFWSQHESEPGRFDWSGERNIAEFCRQAQKEGMQVLIRPGPYICGEYDFGGMPWWLLKDRNMRVRSRHAAFLDAVRRYYNELGKQLAPLQVTKGGPIVMVQVENEYNGYGQDDAYTEALSVMLREAGFDVPLYTSEMTWSLRPSTVPGLIRGVGFGSDPERHLNDLQLIQPNGPMFCSELYTGWYDAWGRGSSVGSHFQVLTNTLEKVLRMGASFNLYMVHGGTSFGFTSGANNPPYTPQTTSYDYGAPIDEAGRPTAKYFAIRETMARHLQPGKSLPPVPASMPTITIPEIKFKETTPILENLSVAITNRWPLPMEALGQGQGCVVYRTVLSPGRKAELTITEPHDFVVVLVDGRPIGTIDRTRRERSIWIPERFEDSTLDLVVEAMGHVNFGPDMERDRKGITERVELDEGFGAREVLDWKMFPMPLTEASLSELKFKQHVTTSIWNRMGVDRKRNAIEPNNLQVPRFFKAQFNLDEIGDTFLDLRSWSKGVVWVNGHNLGRFWAIGPQQTLYLPAPWLKRRGNEIVVLDLLGPGKATISGITNSILNELNHSSVGRLHRKPSQKLLTEKLKPVANGLFPSDLGWQLVKFTPTRARYLCLEALTSQANDGYSTCAELNIVDAVGRNIPKSGWRILYADSEELLGEDGSSDRALDGRPETFWHTRWDGGKNALPHQIVIDIGQEYIVTGVRYLPRQDKPNGRIGEYNVYVDTKPFPGL